MSIQDENRILVENIRKTAKNKGLSLTKLEKEFNFGNGTIGRWPQAKKYPPADRVEKIAKRLGVSVDFLWGRSKQVSSESDIAGYNMQVNPEAIADAVARKLANYSPDITDDVVEFPILGSVAAGYDHMGFEDWGLGNIIIPKEWLKGRSREDYFVLRVEGDSMYPMYMDGDIVLVLKQKTMNRPGEIGVVLYDDESTTLKRIDYVDGEDWMLLTPINPQYPPIKIEGEALEHCDVLGIPRMLIREINQ